MAVNKKKSRPVFMSEGKEARSAELISANEEIAFQHLEKEKRADELIIANNELAFQNKEKGKRAAELVIANKELAYQNQEKEQRAAELIIANKELAFQNKRKEMRAIELSMVNKELNFQNKEKEKRAAELSLANIELVFQNDEKEKRAAELKIANIELAFQNEEKEKRAAELIIANIELAFQNDEKEKRAAELAIANKELIFQNHEKEKRAAELKIANEELAFQNEEKEKRAAELSILNKDLTFKYEERLKEVSDYKYSLDESSILAITDQKGVIKYVNDNFCRISKYSKEELIGLDHRIINSGYHPKEFIKKIWKTISSGKVWKGEIKNKAKDGTIYWVDTTIVPFLDENKKPFQYVAIRSDITERKRVEEEVIKNLYAFISQVNQNIVRVKDEATLFRNSCNMAIEFGKFKMAWIGMFDFENKKISLVEQCGVTEEEQDLFTNVSYETMGPQDRVLQTGTYFISNDIHRDIELAGWKPYCFNRGLNSAIILPIKKSGQIVGTFNLYSTEVNFSGKEELQLLVEVTNDISFALELFEKEKVQKITEMLVIKSEKQLNEAQRIAHVGSWELNFEADTTLWSDEASRIYGIPFSETHHTYQTWLSFVHPEDLEMVKEETGRSKQTLKGASIKHRILLKDGTVKYIHSITKLEFNSQGKPIGLIGVCHDITAGKQAEQKLAQEIRHSKKHQSMLLSSQINPHFIFNALNSVQYFILLKENTESALNFVADFSLLMRTALMNSRSEFIPIADEIKFLELYLKLEQQRFQKKFIYDIVADPGVDTEEMYIPPMVIQPYLENAVIHGLANSNDHNKVVIRFSKVKNHIVCKITDNGIGRQKAMALKKLKNDPRPHESMGMKITETKIKLLNELYNDSFIVEVKDLTDAEGKPSGTEAGVTLPILDEEAIFGLA